MCFVIMALRMKDYEPEPLDVAVHTLGYRQPGGQPVIIGVALLNRKTNQLRVAFPKSFHNLVEESELDIFEALGPDLAQKAAEMGEAGLIEYMLATFSNNIIISDATQIQ